ncbi:hypothetical protein V1477_016104 [Vespula maculifrons]|uniref:Uncharacterized protein n=1 Tax=Vespula maculifrons TaxID=7453 RepID=A0ABD2BCQ5_VESMC
MRSGDSRLRTTTTKSGLETTFILCFELRRVNLENIAVPTRISTDEQLIQIYNSLFDFRLKCEVGILGFERRQQSRALKQHL